MAWKRVAQDTLEAVTDDLEKALAKADKDDAKYHIRQAAQRVVAANGKPDK